MSRLENLEMRSAENNAQQEFKSFKEDVVKQIRTAAKKAIPKLDQKINDLRTRQKTLSNFR